MTIDDTLPPNLVTLCERFLCENEGDESKAAAAMVEHLTCDSEVYGRDDPVLAAAIETVIRLVAKNKSAP